MKKKISALLACIVCAALALTVMLSVNAADVDYGNVDGQEGVTAADARLALRIAVKLENATDDQIKAADVDGQQGVTAADARLILRYAVKLEKEFPAQKNAAEPASSDPTSASSESTTKAPSPTRPSVAPRTTAPATESTTSEQPAEPTTPSEPESTTIAEPVTEEPATEEPVTEEPVTEPTVEEPTDPVDDFEPYGDLIALKSGNVHVRSKAFVDGELTPMEFALDGTNFYMRASSDDIDLGVLMYGKPTLLNTNIYVISWGNNQYHQLSKAEKATVKALGLDVDELVSQIDAMNSKMSLAGVHTKTEEYEYDGKTCTAEYFQAETGSVRYIMDGDKLLRSDVLDADGNLDSYNIYEMISGDTSDVIRDITKDKTLKSVSGIAFISGLASLMGITLT